MDTIYCVNCDNEAVKAAVDDNGDKTPLCATCASAFEMGQDSFNDPIMPIGDAEAYINAYHRNLPPDPNQSDDHTSTCDYPCHFGEPEEDDAEVDPPGEMDVFLHSNPIEDQHLEAEYEDRISGTSDW